MLRVLIEEIQEGFIQYIADAQEILLLVLDFN